MRATESARSENARNLSRLFTESGYIIKGANNAPDLRFIRRRRRSNRGRPARCQPRRGRFPGDQVGRHQDLPDLGLWSGPSMSAPLSRDDGTAAELRRRPARERSPMAPGPLLDLTLSLG